MNNNTVFNFRVSKQDLKLIEELANDLEKDSIGRVSKADAVRYAIRQMAKNRQLAL